MVLSSPIAVKLFYDPISAYAELTSILEIGQKYTQSFDYNTVECPSANVPKRLEDLYPNSTVLGTDGDIVSSEPSQGSLGCCGTVATICALASIPSSFPHALENSIYPARVSPYGLYLVKVANPDDPLRSAWVAIDSNVSCTAKGKSDFLWLNDGDALAPALFLKAAATMRGGSYDGITNSDPFKKSFKWFPSTSIKATTFAEFAEALAAGGTYIFSMAQQYDASGSALNPLGVVYGHAFSAPETLTVKNPDGTEVNLVRISNPWGGGSDFQSEYSEGAPFWASHPELADKLAIVSQAGGEYWVSWNQFKSLSGNSSFNVVVPLPVPARPHIDYFKYEFDGVPALSTSWSNWTAELVAGVPLDRQYTLTLKEPAIITFDVSWLSGSGSRHLNLKIVDPTTQKLVGQFSEEVWWADSKQRQVSLPAGTFKVYPCTRSFNTDRGILQVIVSSDKSFAQN